MAMSMTQRLRYEGFKEGFIEGQQIAIFAVLTKRFGPIPESIRERIQGIRDEVVLESLYFEAAFCKSLDDFQTKLL